VSELLGAGWLYSSRLPPLPRRRQVFKMLARTSTLAIVASLAAVVVAAPWGDGEDIKVSSSRCLPSLLSLTSFSNSSSRSRRSTTTSSRRPSSTSVAFLISFSSLSLADPPLLPASQQVHDATEHDKNFNQIDAKNKDVLKAVAFRKDDDDVSYFSPSYPNPFADPLSLPPQFFYKRADIFVDSLDLREAAGFNFEFDLKNEIGLDADVDFDRFKRVRSLSARAPLPLVDLVIFLQIGDVNDFGVLHKRWDGDGEDIKVSASRPCLLCAFH